MYRRSPLFLLALLLVLPACRSAVQDVYFDARDRLGTPRRELLADRVEKARETQQEAREEFASALDAFQSVTGFQGGDLEDLYRRQAHVLGEEGEVGEREEGAQGSRIIFDIGTDESAQGHPPPLCDLLLFLPAFAPLQRW